MHQLQYKEEELEVERQDKRKISYTLQERERELQEERREKEQLDEEKKEEKKIRQELQEKVESLEQKLQQFIIPQSGMRVCVLVVDMMYLYCFRFDKL